MTCELPESINICRLCLEHQGEFGLENPLLALKIFDCTSIRVDEDKELPMSICVECMTSVKFCHEFRNKCLQANDILLKRLENATFIANPSMSFTPDYGDDDEADIKHEDTIDATLVQNGLKNIEMKKRIKRSKRINVVKVIKKSEKESMRKKNAKGMRTEKSFQCDFCGKIIRRKCHFVRHCKIHSDEKPYACELCSKTFKIPQHLKVHRRTHTNERPYQCKFCGNTFRDHSAVSRHQKIHTNDKRYSCPNCSKRFMTRYDLNKHVMRHTGLKVYVCGICSQAYADKSSLVNHMKKHEGQLKKDKH